MKHDPCPRGGHKYYNMMKLENAVLPSNIPGLIRDKSPDALNPLPGSGFNSGLYYWTIR